MANALKRCSGCSKEKPTEKFGKNRSTSDGLQRRCKACCRRALADWYKAHPGKRAEQSRIYRKKNPEKCRERMRRWNVEHLEEHREDSRKRYRTNPEKYRARQLKNTYGISIEEYDSLLEKQGGGCAICGAQPFSERAGGKRLSVDHDHRTGKVRGILCASCNFSLGKMWDEVVLVQKMLDYIKQAKA